MNETTYETLSYSEQYYRAQLEYDLRADFFMMMLSVCVCASLVFFLVGGFCTVLYDRIKNKR